MRLQGLRPGARAPTYLLYYVTSCIQLLEIDANEKATQLKFV